MPAKPPADDEPRRGDGHCCASRGRDSLALATAIRTRSLAGGHCLLPHVYPGAGRGFDHLEEAAVEAASLSALEEGLVRPGRAGAASHASVRQARASPDLLLGVLGAGVEVLRRRRPPTGRVRFTAGSRPPSRNVDAGAVENRSSLDRPPWGRDWPLPALEACPAGLPRAAPRPGRRPLAWATISGMSLATGHAGHEYAGPAVAEARRGPTR